MKLYVLHEETLQELNWAKVGLLPAAALALGLATTSVIKYANSPRTTQEVPSKPREAQKVQEVPSKPREAQKIEKPIRPEHNKDIMKHIMGNEGFEASIYDDERGGMTIGFGHLLYQKNSSRRAAQISKSRTIFSKLFGNEIDFDKILQGRPITREQALKLLDYDYKEHVDRARSRFPALDSYPPYLQQALIDSTFRGEKMPITDSLINAGKWREAAKEYLNYNQYKNAAALRIRGIISRMERNRDALLRMADEGKS